jgi:hypothetical protein
VKKAVIAALAVSAVGVAAAGGLYAYDESRSDVIPEGITAGGVPLGGMTPKEAGAVLEHRLGPRLRRPLTLRRQGSTFVMSAESLGVAFDADATARRALAEGREGTFLARAVRGLVGRPVRARVPLQVDYSDDAVAALMARVGRALERPVRNARIDPSPMRLRVIVSRTGLAVGGRPLGRAIARTLVTPDSPRLIDVPVHVRKPKVTVSALEARYPVFVTISRRQKRLRLYRRLELAKAYEIAVGQAGYDTPAGLHHIRSKAINPAWYVPDKVWAGELARTVVPPGSPDNPIKAR